MRSRKGTLLQVVWDTPQHPAQAQHRISSPGHGRHGRRSRLPLALAILLAALGGVTDLAAQTYEYEVLILHPPGLVNSQAVRINRGTQEVVGQSWSLNSDEVQALLWTGAGTNVKSLNPGTAYSSHANSIGGPYVGGARASLGMAHSVQAMAWGTYTYAPIAMHPSAMAESAILGTGSGKFAGWAGGQPTSWAQHAMLWTSTEANAVIDLHPGPTFLASLANDIDPAGRQQVGVGELIVDINSEGNHFTIKTEDHALLWEGSAASMVDLHPAGFASSQATAAANARQVGYGKPAGTDYNHALLWEGSAASVVDLHPAGFTESLAGGLWEHDGYQVGTGWGPSTGQAFHALLWRGRPETVIDLHAFLPAGYVASVASDIDENAHAVGWATTASGDLHAVLWRRLPDLHSIWLQGGSRFQGGQYAELLVVLDGPAVGDAYVELSSSDPTVAAVPQRQTASTTFTGTFPGTVVPSGSQTTLDGIRLTPVAVDTPITITATYRAASVSATLTVIPANITSVSVSPRSVECGQTATGTVILDGQAPAGGATVQLSGRPAGISLPGSVTIPAWTDRTTFTARTSNLSPSINTATTNYTVTATSRNVSRQTTLKCLPPA